MTPEDDQRLQDMAEQIAALPAELQQTVADGVAQGLREVLQDPDAIAAVMDAVVATAQRRAAEQAGRAIFGAMRAVLGKWLLIGVIVLMALKLAGVDVALKVWRILTGAAP